MSAARHVTGAVWAAALVAALGWGVELPAQALTRRVSPRIAGTSFVVARYKAGASASVYGAQRLGRGMAILGLVGNPGTGYLSVILGGGTRFRLGARDGVTVLLAGARGTDGTYLRLYALPKVAMGPVVATATAGFRQQIGGPGQREAAIDPFTLSLPVSRALRIGVTGVFSARRGRALDWGAGPSMHLRGWGGSLSLEVISRRQSDHLEVRGALGAAF